MKVYNKADLGCSFMMPLPASERNITNQGHRTPVAGDCGHAIIMLQISAAVMESPWRVQCQTKTFNIMCTSWENNERNMKLHYKGHVISHLNYFLQFTTTDLECRFQRFRTKSGYIKFKSCAKIRLCPTPAVQFCALSASGLRRHFSLQTLHAGRFKW